MKIALDIIVSNVLGVYGFSGQLTRTLPYGCGHINDTYAIYIQQKDGALKPYILQRINTNVFKNPYQLMENIVGVTTYLRDKIVAAGGDPERETLNIIPTLNGNSFFQDETGEYWRCYTFIEDTITLQQAEKSEDMYESAKVFGRFQSLLSDYPAESLHETIPGFHHTIKRYEQLEYALKQDVKGRAMDVQKEISFVMDRKEEAGTLVQLLKEGELPIRVTHNDTKLNNSLIDKGTGKGICAVDLDTVMPGLCHYDFGDAIRFGTNPASEDEKDLEKVWMEESYFDAYTKGYLEEAGKSLTSKEISLLPLGAKIMTLECGVRFLTDYLNGDRYFKIHREEHNLDRCRTQLKLVEDMEGKWSTMVEIVNKYGGELENDNKYKGTTSFLQRG